MAVKTKLAECTEVYFLHACATLCSSRLHWTFSSKGSVSFLTHHFPLLLYFAFWEIGYLIWSKMRPVRQNLWLIINNIDPWFLKVLFSIVVCHQIALQLSSKDSWISYFFQPKNMLSFFKPFPNNFRQHLLRDVLGPLLPLSPSSIVKGPPV